MATEADLIQKFKDLNIPVGADFEELIHEAFTGANLVDKVENHDSRIATVEDNLEATKGSIQSNTDAIENNTNAIEKNTSNIATKANDSTVVHNSGDEEISGSKTFDTAPIDKTTGNPYITKDGVPAVPSTLADTTKDANFTGKLQKSGIDVATTTDVTTAVNTATTNMANYNMPTNFTAGLKSGGLDVATAADLKSVEASAWRRLDFGPDANLGGALVSSYILYQIHADEKYLSFFYLGVSQSEIKTFPDNTTLMDLSSVVKGISRIDFSTSATEINDSTNGASSFQISGTKIITSTNSHKIYIVPNTVNLYPINHNDRRIYYTELV